MKRVVLALMLLASPAAGQTAASLNPYNPYVTSGSQLSLSFRPYSSLDRWNLRNYGRATPNGFFVSAAAAPTLVAPVSRAAAFGYYPNYPSRMVAPSGFGTSRYFGVKSLQPAPLTTYAPTELQCDPYLDDDGCLSEIAGW